MTKEKNCTNLISDGNPTPNYYSPLFKSNSPLSGILGIAGMMSNRYGSARLLPCLRSACPYGFYEPNKIVSSIKKIIKKVSQYIKE